MSPAKSFYCIEMYHRSIPCSSTKLATNHPVNSAFNTPNSALASFATILCHWCTTTTTTLSIFICFHCAAYHIPRPQIVRLLQKKIHFLTHRRVCAGLYECMFRMLTRCTANEWNMLISRARHNQRTHTATRAASNAHTHRDDAHRIKSEIWNSTLVCKHTSCNCERHIVQFTVSGIRWTHALYIVSILIWIVLREDDMSSIIWWFVWNTRLCVRVMWSTNAMKNADGYL